MLTACLASVLATPQTDDGRDRHHQHPGTGDQRTDSHRHQAVGLTYGADDIDGEQPAEGCLRLCRAATPPPCAVPICASRLWPGASSRGWSGRVSTCGSSFALSDDDAAFRLAGIDRPLRAGEGGGDPRAAPRGRRVAPAGRPTQGGLGRPGGVRRAGPLAPAGASKPPAGHAWHDARLVSATDRPTLAVSEQARQTAGGAGDPRLGHQARRGEPAVGAGGSRAS